MKTQGQLAQEMVETMASGVSIQIKPILPGLVNEAHFRNLIRRALREAAKEIVSEFGKGTRTWEHKPQWTTQLRYHTGRNTWKVIVRTSSKPFMYVELGTLKGGRYRLMSKGFQSKTKPKVLRSGAGAGRAAGFIHKGRRPLKGVTPRDFRVVIAKQYKPRYVKKMSLAISAGANRFFSGGGVGQRSTGRR